LFLRPIRSTCEYRDGCEWREKKASEIDELFAQREVEIDARLRSIPEDDAPRTLISKEAGAQKPSQAQLGREYDDLSNQFILACAEHDA